jgi:hypothetical protein
MSFFGDPAPSDDDFEALEVAPPEWLAPPADLLGWAIPLVSVLVRTAEVAVAAHSVVAYPTGFELSLSVFSRASEPLPDPFHYAGPLRAGRAGLVPAGILRFGLEFADGSRCTTLDGPAPSAQRPTAPTIAWRAGQRGTHAARQDFWVWGLPPAGPVQLVCEWRGQAIPETRAAVDAAPIVAGAAKARPVWA